MSSVDDAKPDRRGSVYLQAVLPAAIAVGEPMKDTTVRMVSALGSASTCTRIASLSGIAAQNAREAWFGLGSKASGGFGKAVGAKVIGGLEYGPVILSAAAAIAFQIAVELRSMRPKDEGAGQPEAATVVA